MRNATIATAITATIALAFGLGRWTAPRTIDVAAPVVPARPAPAHVALGIGSCSAASESAPALATLSEQRVAID